VLGLVGDVGVLIVKEGPLVGSQFVESRPACFAVSREDPEGVDRRVAGGLDQQATVDHLNLGLGEGDPAADVLLVEVHLRVPVAVVVVEVGALGVEEDLGRVGLLV